MNVSGKITTAALLLAAALVSVGVAQVPQLINYQGRLTDAADDPVANDTYEVTFRIYDEGSTERWSEVHNIATTNGLFSVKLGSNGSPLDESVFNYAECWLGITVAGDPELVPRTRLITVPYAFEAQEAQSALTVADNAITSLKIANGEVMTDDLDDEAVTSLKIADATIQFVDIADNGAALNQVMKWDGNAWVAAEDETGGGSVGWVDDGNYVRLETDTDSVGIGTATPSEKFDVVGNMLVRGKATIGPGNTNNGTYAFVAGTDHNAYGNYSSIGGGSGQEVTAHYGAIGGGRSNRVDGEYGTVGGGLGNSTNGRYSTVGGGISNQAVDTSTVGGGYGNWAWGNCSTVGGGSYNQAAGYLSVVGGGAGNVARGSHAVVCGGGAFEILTPYDSNAALGDYSCVGGGHSNYARGDYSVVSGGVMNIADNDYATVSGGGQNWASGSAATVPGGSLNVASGSYSFAAGQKSQASHLGSFVWSDAINLTHVSQRNHQFSVRANGGVRLTINGAWVDFYNTGPDIITSSTGAHLSIGGAWTDASDRELKENFASVDRQELLDKIAALPITRWNYKSESDDVTHIGPVAQDFHDLFGVGNDDKSIATLDEAGIALAAIQALYKKTKEIDALKAELAQLKVAQEAEISDLKTELSQLTALVESVLAQQKNIDTGSDELVNK